MDERRSGTTHFAIVPEWVLFEASANAVKVYALLDRYSNAEGDCFPALKRLAEQMDVSTDTVRRAIRDLEEIGAVERSGRERGEDGGQSSNNYRLIRDTPLASGLPPRSKSARGPLANLQGARRTRVKEPDQDLASLGLAGSSEIVIAESKAPKLMKVEGRNLGFDALCEVCKIDPNGNQAGRVAAALNGGKAITVGIRDLAWRDLLTANPTAIAMDAEAFEHYLASMIRERAKDYRTAMRGAMLTPTALATWWTDLRSQELPYNAMQHLRDLRVP